MGEEEDEEEDNRNKKDAKRMRKGRANIMRNGKEKKIIVHYTTLCQT